MTDSSKPIQCDQCGTSLEPPQPSYMIGINGDGTIRYACKTCYIAHYRTDLAPCRYCGQNTDTRLIGWGKNPIPFCDECLKKVNEPVSKPADQHVVIDINIHVINPSPYTISYQPEQPLGPVWTDVKTTGGKP
jgi:hypothetical protein